MFFYLVPKRFQGQINLLWKTKLKYTHIFRVYCDFISHPHSRLKKERNKLTLGPLNRFRIKRKWTRIVQKTIKVQGYDECAQTCNTLYHGPLSRYNSEVMSIVRVYSKCTDCASFWEAEAAGAAVGGRPACAAEARRAGSTHRLTWRCTHTHFMYS